MSKHTVQSAAQHLQDLAATAARTAEALGPQIAQATQWTRECLAAGGTLFFCGNGGSAADAQHIATEYTIRYLRERKALRAVALTTDTSALTAAGNDFGFDEVFSRQVEALGRAGDLLFVHTTSGNSPNCLRAIESARALGMKTVALTAKDGGKVKGMADLTLIVPTTRTDRAQELHLAIQHAICDAVDAEVAG
ncbi:MAG: SIS domain-containing protein [Gemmatimonadaceae bacterium]|nr:SIS domain-containing protein [Gemmatimonadaceae bacterium]MCW5825416.1 SIS domain-containing protein [Gemmatimonadaceae bacterium]